MTTRGPRCETRRRTPGAAAGARAQGWLLVFATAVIAAARAARRLAAEIEELEQRWLELADHPRQDSAARKLIGALPGQPMLRVADVTTLTGASQSAAHEAVRRLERSGVLKQVTVGRRNRAWEAQGLLDLIDAFERDLATPVGAQRAVRHAPAAR